MPGFFSEVYYPHNRLSRPGATLFVVKLKAGGARRKWSCRCWCFSFPNLQPYWDHEDGRRRNKRVTECVWQVLGSVFLSLSALCNSRIVLGPRVIVLDMWAEHRSTVPRPARHDLRANSFHQMCVLANFFASSHRPSCNRSMNTWGRTRTAAAELTHRGQSWSSSK